MILSYILYDGFIEIIWQYLWQLIRKITNAWHDFKNSYFPFQLDISIFKSVPYHCPGKGYVCGYSRVPMDNYGNVQVKCCTGKYEIK